MPPVYRNNKQKKGDGKNEKQDIGRKIASGPVCQHSRYGAGDQSAQRIGELVIFQYCGVISHLAEIGGHKEASASPIPRKRKVIPNRRLKD